MENSGPSRPAYKEGEDIPIYSQPQGVVGVIVVFCRVVGWREAYLLYAGGGRLFTVWLTALFAP